MWPVTRTGRTVDERLARLREQVPHDERRVAHHVVEHAAALQRRPARTTACAARCAPRPRARGTAGPSSRRRAPRAARVPSRPAARRAGSRGSRSASPTRATSSRDLLRLGDVARERLLAGEPSQRAAARSRSRARSPRRSRCARGSGPQSQIASIAGSATMSAIDAYALRVADVERRARARPRCSAFSRFGLQTPRTSASRTPTNACMWKRALKPLPMKPTPSRRSAVIRPGIARVHQVVTDAELLRAPPAGQPFQSGLKTLPM